MPGKKENKWQTLYGHESEIYGYIKSTIGDGEIARDLYQDVFLSAIQHLDQLDSERSLKNWLYTVTRNRVINYLRSKNRRETVELSEQHRISTHSEVLDAQLIQKIFLKMNPLHRRILLWHLNDGYSYEEIAEKLRRSMSAVTSLIHRARESFKRYYIQEFLPKNMSGLPDIEDLLRFIDPLSPDHDLFTRIDKRVLEYFSVLNRQWDKVRSDFISETDLEYVLSLLDLPPDARVADLGSGTGFVAFAMAARGYEIFALDFNSVMTRQLLETARELGFGNIRPVQANIRSLPFQEGCLHALFFTLVLHHLPNPMDSLHHALTRVIDGGYIICIDFLRHYEKELADTMHDLWLGFDPAVIEKHLKQNGAVLKTAGEIEGATPIRSFFQVYVKAARQQKG